jgi:hypothetical protein
VPQLVAEATDGQEWLVVLPLAPPPRTLVVPLVTPLKPPLAPQALAERWQAKRPLEVPLAKQPAPQQVAWRLMAKS